MPGLRKAGGFTITSTPSQALPAPSASPPSSSHINNSHDHSHSGNTKNDDRDAGDRNGNNATPYLELAVQNSPSNPPAAWLWRFPDEILGSELHVRVGGSFTWPPHGWSAERVRQIRKIIFVAGGVGINPLISMVASIFENRHVARDMRTPRAEIVFLYSTKIPSPSSTSLAGGDATLEYGSADEILFLPRLRSLSAENPSMRLSLYLTGSSSNKYSTSTSKFVLNDIDSAPKHHRIGPADLEDALGRDEELRRETVVYVCGPPAMTDEIVAWFEGNGLDGRVFCEKWW